MKYSQFFRLFEKRHLSGSIKTCLILRLSLDRRVSKKDRKASVARLGELSERAEEAEMKFDDAKLRIVNLMAQKTLSIRELASIMSFASQAFDNIYKDIEQGKYKEVAGGEL